MVYFIIGMSEENTYFALRRFPISIHSFIHSHSVYNNTEKIYNTDNIIQKARMPHTTLRLQ